MKMRFNKAVFVIFLIFVFLLAACSKKGCETALDCTPKHAFSAACINNECVYSPIPGICGNTLCETGENKCTCPQDCGPCTGPVQGSKYLIQKCVRNQCLQDVPENKIKPVFDSKEVSNRGDKFRIETFYNNPFNLKKDLFKVKISLISQGPKNRNERITGLELSGVTADRKTVGLSSKKVNKVLWSANSFIKEDLILSIPTSKIEGLIKNLVLTVNYEYVFQQTPTKTLQKKSAFKVNLGSGFVFVKPASVYPCPESCDDNNPGTRDYCGPETNYFCAHEPIPGTCGNFICESFENKCTCPVDCGPCSGSAGSFLNFVCIKDECKTVLKPGISATPTSIFDERKISGIALNNNYEFNNPFNIKSDKFVLKLSLYSLPSDISNFKIESVRLLDGAHLIAEDSVNQVISTSSPRLISITIPGLSLPEEEHSTVLKVWYSFNRDGKTYKGTFSKSLGKITFINPE